MWERIFDSLNDISNKEELALYIGTNVVIAAIAIYVVTRYMKKRN